MHPPHSAFNDVALRASGNPLDAMNPHGDAARSVL